MRSLSLRSDTAGIWRDICDICPKQLKIKRTSLQMKPALALITISLLSFLLGSTPVLALDPSLDVSQYAHTAWKIREGFVAGTIHQIAQTRDGYLWLATESGLVRFDGVRTVAWQPPSGKHLPSNDIRSIVAARDGTLWLGTAKGLVSWKDGELTEYPDLAGRDIYTVYEDRQGMLWASGITWENLSTPGKVCAVKSRDIQCYGSDGKFGLGVFSFYEDSRGCFWLAAANGLWRWKPGKPQRYGVPAALRAGTSSLFFKPNAICEDDGTLLIAAQRGFGKLLNGKIEAYPYPAGMPLREAATLFRDRDGGLWIGTIEAGILHQHRARMDAFTDSDGLSSNSVQTFFEDREGNMWAATENGIDRFRELAVPTLSVRQGLSSPTVVCLLAGRDGSVWMGTTDGLDRWKDGQVTVYRRPGKEIARQNIGLSNVAVREIPLQDNMIESLYQDRQDRIWVSTQKGLGYFQNETFIPLKGAPAASAIPVTGDNAGNIWIASSYYGLLRLREGKLVERLPWASLRLPNSGSNSIVVDPIRGGLWLATWSGGVFYYKDGSIQASWGPAQGLGIGRVTDLKLDADGSVWAATEGGLSRIKDGRVVTLTSHNGLPCDSVHDFAEDNTHTFWLYTACGLVRILRAELDAWSSDPGRTVQAEVFDTSDGIRSHAGDYYPSPRVAKSADGRLWFLPLDGVSIVDPQRLPLINKLPPPVHIEQITADSKVYDANAAGNGRLRLPPLVRNLAIDYTALSLVAPEKVHFRYKLEGQNRNWHEVVNDREVQYTNLGPGNYRFRVLACNNSGVWNEEGAALDFVILPAWYQTNWFRALCVAAFVTLLWALYQLRLQQLAKRFNVRLEERVGERTRIARDLHDTLLQSFHGILLHLQVLSNELPGGTPKERLESVIDQAEQAIVEGRDAVEGLRTSTVERNDLALAIRTLGEELAASNSRRPDFTVQVEGAPRNLHPILRDEVYRIVGEAMRNAFRHAAAQRIEVEIRYDEQQLRLRVRDNGKGIAPKLIGDDGHEGHFGLRGMRERAKLIGGKLTVWSELNSGTEVELSIPAARAYLAAVERRRSGLLEKLAGKFFGKDPELKA
jgi:signal transduction histidine kinase/ligand-binding sensor domain-containing protein